MPPTAPIEQVNVLQQNTSLPSSDDQVIADLARQLTTSTPRGSSFTIPARLKQFMQFFQECFEHFEETNKAQVSTSQSSEWLMDNFYVIEQAIRQVEQDLPADYYRRLPKTSAGVARISIVALANTRREESRLEIEQIKHFLQVFQEFTPLSTGELWALPLMLRLTVLESLAKALAAVTQLKWNSMPNLSVEAFAVPELQY